MMPRRARIIPEEGAMHIMCRGNNKQYILPRDQDKLRYYILLKRYKGKNHIDILHYCIMNNHVHLIVRLNSRSLISKFMKQVNLSYSIYYRKNHDYCGHVWQGRFKSNLVDTDIYLMRCGKYIELNPSRAGLVEDPARYLYSSYNFYVNGQPDPVLSFNPVYLELSTCPETRRIRYKEFVLDHNIFCHETFANHMFIGNQQFIEKMETLYKIANSKKLRGRPKNIESSKN